jgi:hypothetical protein
MKSHHIVLCAVFLTLTCSNSESDTGSNGGGGGSAGSLSGMGGSSQTGGAGGDSSGGSQGTGGVAGGGTGGAASPGASVLERNNHPSRDGHFVEPRLTRAAAATMKPDGGFHADFTGQMYASPLYLENGPANKGVFFAVTTGNDVFALDETTGAVVWTKNIGPAAQDTGAGCGNVHPLGILGTPVIDAASRTIYVAGAIGPVTIQRHEVHALSVDDGTERPGWPATVKVSAGNVTFTASPENQRGALSLLNGILYVPYGGHWGDCGAYHGWVIAIDTKNPQTIAGWTTEGSQSGIWAPGGLASDGTGVFAITGNQFGPPATHTDSEEMVKLTGMAVVDRKDIFYPTHWSQMDQNDADFGSNSAVYVEVPGATPGALAVSAAKDGHVYFVDSKNMGGMGGQVFGFVVNGGLFTTPTAYTTSKGVHVALAGASLMGCDGSLISMLIPPGSPPKPEAAWCARLGGGGASPISTTTNGTDEAIVWMMSNTALHAVDGDSGESLFDGGTDGCPGVRSMTSAIAVKGRIVVGADGHLCSWSPQ